MSKQFPIIEISTQPIELCKLLKIANMVSGGGEAKIVISEGYVLLNDEVEYQKRKKVYDNDIVQFNGETIQVVYIPQRKKAQSDLLISKTPNEKLKSKKLSSSKNIAPKSNKNKINHEHISVEPVNLSRRKPISF